MRKLTTLLILAILISSCSDNLTNSKAEDIISDCLESNPKVGKTNFRTGEIRFYTEKDNQIELLNKYKNIAEEGLITLDSVKSSKRYKHTTYNVSFTDKAKEYVLETDKKNMFGRNSNTSVIRTYDYEVDEVKEVHEIPSMNSAEVTIIYKKENKTPFSDFEKDKSDFITKKIGFRKTTSDGWKYCE
ncbi:hypothetical protein [uncultured Winogradskyella sp.]|uniref:hypothetical protein n=1 Tax=uncultured Winogradskyella sp. TaxID=395353 RepID=UPI0030EE04E2|tara:strand:- start:858 stop:1418 length:561 start_codon:yes stop_codon:yes gene_type:complete